jgi:hypothetical protein
MWCAALTGPSKGRDCPPDNRGSVDIWDSDAKVPRESSGKLPTLVEEVYRSRSIAGTQSRDDVPIHVLDHLPWQESCMRKVDVGDLVPVDDTACHQFETT